MRAPRHRGSGLLLLRTKTSPHAAQASLAQLARARGCEPQGREFEPPRERHSEAGDGSWHARTKTSGLGLAILAKNQRLLRIVQKLP